MDKYKTSQLGQSLKRVFRGESSITDSVSLAQGEIKAVFDIAKNVDTNIGIVGERLGVCPLCGKEIVNGRKSYYCSGYKDGCNFSIWKFICKKAISVSNAKALLSSGKTGKISGFVSKNDKQFDAALKLDESGKVVFDFS
jgi:DNA topoisomerase-3